MKHDPKLVWCRCGYHFYPGLYEKIVMLVKGQYVKRCPRCQTKMTFRLIYHVVKVETMEVKGKDKLWRNG